MMKSKMFNLLPDSIYLTIKYYYCFHQKLDLKNPKTFNEKLQWLKLYNRKDIYSKMVDKYESKELIAKKVGEKYIVKTYGIYNCFDDIDFNKLPNKFVLKCTHDSGGLVIVKDKKELNIDTVKKKIKDSLKTNYYKHGREWPYKNVKPRIIAEELLENKDGSELVEYNYFCFNGIPKIVMTCFGDKDKNRYNTFYDLDFNKLPFKCSYQSSDIIEEKPDSFDEMVELSKILSKDIPFLRVDFYLVNNKVKIGELTFFHWSGFGKFSPKEWDLKLGEMLELNFNNKEV